MNKNKEIFTVYILGILENGLGNRNYGNSLLIIDSWNNFLRHNIVNMIPERYEIRFIHCDIVDTPNQRKRLRIPVNRNITNENIQRNPWLIETILRAKYQLCLQDMEDPSLNHRVVQSQFTVLPLDFVNIGSQRNYLILDMAGVFRRDNLQNSVLTIYKSTHNRRNVIFKNLNVVNLPYISTNKNSEYNISPNDFAKTRFLRINEDGNVITYEQRLIEINAIRDFMGTYKIIFDQVLRNKGISVVNNSPTKQLLKNLHLQIMEIIMDNLMDTRINTYNEWKKKSINDINLLLEQ
jgi:hypothetical protein